MAGSTIILGNWNDTTPAAPSGYDNIKFGKDASNPPNIAAAVPRADVAGTKYGTILYDGSGNPNRYLGADGEFHDLPAGSLPNGGTTGQVLAKASGTDGDVEWADQASGGVGMVFEFSPNKGSALSTGAYATKGLTIIPIATIPLAKLILRLTLVQNAVYRARIYRMESEANNAKIAEIIDAGVDYTAAAAYTFKIFKLGFSVETVELAEGTPYFIGVSRTDDTDTYALPIAGDTASGNALFEKFPAYPTVYHMRFAKKAPAVDDVAAGISGRTEIGVLFEDTNLF